MGTTFFHLMHHPDCLERLVEELMDTFGNEEEIAMGPKLESCKYFQACIDEAMRLIPSVPNMLPRKVQQGGTTVDDEFLPEGTIVGCAQWSLHRNQELFHEPEAFRPERWLGDQELSTNAKRAYAPFGFGSRTCVGWRLALTETKLTLAKTLFRYQVRLAPSSPCCLAADNLQSCQYDLKGYAVAVGDGPYVQFRQRSLQPDS